jgi:hypothetical protein
VGRRALGRGSIIAAALLGALGSLGAGTPAAAISPQAMHAAAAASPTAGPTPTDATALVGLAVSAPRGAALRSGQDLALSGAITNPGTVELPAGVLQVRVQSRLSDREALASAFADPASVGGDVVATVPTPAVAAGATAALSLSVPAAVIGALLAPAGWGPHAIAVALDVPGSPEISTSSAVVWADDTPPSTVQTTVMLPITVAPGQSGILSADELSAATAADGPLTRKLEALASSPATVAALDPRIIASIRVLGLSAPTSALDWLAQLSALPNAVMPLQYADADLAIERAAGAAAPIGPLSVQWAVNPADFGASQDAPSADPSPETGTGTTPGTGDPLPVQPAIPSLDDALDWSYSADDIAWPSADSLSAADLPFLASAGYRQVIVASSNLAASGSSYDAVASLDGTDALVTDAGISADLSGAAFFDDAAQAQQSLAKAAAQLAAVARERPGQLRTVFVTLDRAAQTSGGGIASTLSALRALPAVAEAGFGALSASADPQPVQLVDAARTGADVVSHMFDQDARIAPYASVIAVPELLIGRERTRLLAVLSAGWAGDEAGWIAAATETSTHFDEVLHSVTVVRGSPVLAVGNFEDVPVFVRNDLGYPVDVVITPRPGNGRVIMQPLRATIGPGESQRVGLPAKLIANGKVSIGVTLTSASTGLVIDGPTYVSLDVQAYWETVALIVAGVLVVGLFGFGIYRNIARRRRVVADVAPEPAE